VKLASPRYRLVYQGYWRLKSHPLLITTGLGSVTALGLVSLFNARLAKILIILDPGLSAQLCIGVGAALIGLIAVVFTLSLFVIQQISDRSVPGILREYAADGPTRAVYATLSGLAVICLLGVSISSRHHPVLAFSVPLFCAIGSLILLSVLFERVAFLSDPSNIIRHIAKTGSRELKRLRKIQDELLRFNPDLKNEVDPFGRQVDNVGLALSAMYAKAPFLTRRFAKSLTDLHSLMRHLSSEQQYSLLNESSSAVVSLLGEYVLLRGSSLTMASSIHAMMGMELKWDSLVVTSIETLAALIRTAVETGDTQRAQILLRSLAWLAHRAIEASAQSGPPDEHPTVDFINGYLTAVLQQGIAKKNVDVVLAWNDSLVQVASALAKSKYASSFRILTEAWVQAGTLAVLSRQTISATDCAGTLLKLIDFLVQQPDLAHYRLIKDIRDKIMTLCEAEASLGATGQPLGSKLSASPDTPIRIAMSGVAQTSFHSIHARIVNRVVTTYPDEKHESWDDAMMVLTEFNDGLWMRFERVGKASLTGNESVLFNLNQAAFAIGEQLLWLWRQIEEIPIPNPDLYSITDREERVRIAGRLHRRQDFKQEGLEELLSWHIIAFYSRCTTLLPATANDSDLRGCLQSATALGIQALGLGLSELAVKTIETVARSCSTMLKQGGVAKLVDNCRTISILPEVGLIAEHENDGDVVTTIQKVVFSLFAEAKDLAGQQPDAFQNWSAPNRLILERLMGWANGENPDGLFGDALSTVEANIHSGGGANLSPDVAGSARLSEAAHDPVYDIFVRLDLSIKNEISKSELGSCHFQT
jgi:hypothetical protein